MTKSTILFLMLPVLLVVTTAHAESCPLPNPDDRTIRRALAKEWFVKGETASKARDDLGAIRAFQCSMSLIAHGFTAFNLAQVAERTGDLELAIVSYSQYLTLLPNAVDKDDVQNTIATLKERLAQVTQETAPASQTREQTKARDSTTESSPTPLGTNAKPLGTDGLVSKVESGKEGTPKVNGASHFGTAAWVTVGAGVAMIGAGVGCNLLARSKKSTSNSRFEAGDHAGSDAAFSSAKMYAYTSYGLLAAGAVAATVGVALGLWPRAADKVEISLLPGGGLALSVTGRYE